MDKKICVIGAGRWGKNHIKTLHTLGYLGGIVDKDPKRLEVFKKQFPEIDIFTDYKKAAKNGFSGFTVATPAKTHYKIARYLLELNFPILVEKPITLTAAEAIDLKNMAEEKNVNLMVGHVMLFHPAIRKIKALIQEGKIGKLQYLYSNRLNLGTVRKEENILWSFAPHDISIFQYLTESFPIEVISRGGNFIQPDVDDSTMTVLTYPKNIVGHIFVSWLHPFKEHRLVVVGSKGMISFEDSSKDKDLLFYEKGIDWVGGEPIKRDGPTEKIPYKTTLPLTAELDYFYEHLNGVKPEISDSQNAIEVLRILEMATRSLNGN